MKKKVVEKKEFYYVMACFHSKFLIFEYTVMGGARSHASHISFTKKREKDLEDSHTSR
jgi:hypothetical protein